MDINGSLNGSNIRLHTLEGRDFFHLGVLLPAMTNIGPFVYKRVTYSQNITTFFVSLFLADHFIFNGSIDSNFKPFFAGVCFSCFLGATKQVQNLKHVFLNKITKRTNMSASIRDSLYSPLPQQEPPSFFRRIYEYSTNNRIIRPIARCLRKENLDEAIAQDIKTLSEELRCLEERINKIMDFLEKSPQLISLCAQHWAEFKEKHSIKVSPPENQSLDMLDPLDQKCALIQKIDMQRAILFNYRKFLGKYPDVEAAVREHILVENETASDFISKEPRAILSGSASGNKSIEMQQFPS